MADFRYVTLQTESVDPKKIQFELEEISRTERLARAGKSLGIFWVCAVAAIFIPIVHFFLVPSLLLAGLFFAANGYSDSLRLKSKDFQCLKCGTNLSLPSVSDQFPKWGTCSNCASEHQLSVSDQI